MILDALDGELAAAAASVDGLLEPDEVAAEALVGLADGRFLVMPGGERGPAKYVARKAQDRERWLDGMRRLNSKLHQK